MPLQAPGPAVLAWPISMAVLSSARTVMGATLFSRGESGSSKVLAAVARRRHA
jgi:hypothetical protein